MTKRAFGKFPRTPRDDYATPREALEPLLPYLERRRYLVIEPCPGEGALVQHLCAAGYEVRAVESDARTTDYGEVSGCIFVTNPPWSRSVLHPIILNLSDQASTWLLFDSDWMHTKQAIPYLKRLRVIISVGRVKWIVGSKTNGFDNCCWHLFDGPSDGPVTFFHGRSA